jgi:hypothetical protein
MRSLLSVLAVIAMLAAPAYAQYSLEQQTLSKDMVVQGAADPKSDATALTDTTNKPSLPHRMGLPPQEDAALPKGAQQVDPAQIKNQRAADPGPTKYNPYAAPDSLTALDTPENNPKHNATGLGRQVTTPKQDESTQHNPAHQLDPAVKDIAGGSGNYTDEPECPEGQAALPLQGGWQCVKPDIECPEGKKPHRALGGWECVDK